MLSEQGIYVAVGGGPSKVLEALLLGSFLSLLGRKKVAFFIAKVNQKDLIFLRDLLGSGKVRPVIDRDYPLSKTAEALRYLAEGHAQGKVVLAAQG